MACAHELVLNGACYYCGSTDLDPAALSPKPAEAVVPADRLRRKPREEEPGSDELPPEPAPET